MFFFTVFNRPENCFFCITSACECLCLKLERGGAVRYLEIYRHNSNKFEAPNFVQPKKTWKITMNGSWCSFLLSWCFFFMGGNNIKQSHSQSKATTIKKMEMERSKNVCLSLCVCLQITTLNKRQKSNSQMNTHKIFNWSRSVRFLVHKESMQAGTNWLEMHDSVELSIHVRKLCTHHNPIARTVQIFGVEKVIKTPFEINFRDAFSTTTRRSEQTKSAAVNKRVCIHANA